MGSTLQWVYHETEKAKVIDRSELEDHQKKGWETRPIKKNTIRDNEEVKLTAPQIKKILKDAGKSKKELRNCNRPQLLKMLEEVRTNG